MTSAYKDVERKRAEAEEIFVVSVRDRLQKEGRIVIDRKKLASLGAVKE